MANLLKSIGNYVKMTAWDQPTSILKDVAHGDFSKGFDDFKGTFGDNERGESEIANSLGIRGWVGDHPGETAGAVVGSILGGIYAAGAYGGAGAASAGAGSGSAAGMSGIGAGSVSATPFSAAGSSLAYAPSSSSVLAGTGSQGIASGAGTSALSYAPTQSTVLGGAGSGIAPDFSAGLGSSGSSGINPQLIQQGISKLQQNQNQQGSAPQITLHTKSGSFNYQPPTSTAYSQAQQLLNQALGTNQFSTNPFRR